MRVLIIAPVPFFVDRGTPMRILEEALALEKRGCDITIATYHLGRGIKTIAPKTKIKVSRVHRLLFWYNKKEAGPDWQKIVLDIFLIWKTLRNAFLKKPEIIHAHLHEGVLIGWIVKKILFWRKIKLVADFHGGLVSEMKSHGYLKGGFLKKLFTFLENLIFSLGDDTIVSSEELKDKISRKNKSKKITVVLDGVNLSNYKSLKPSEASGKFVIIYSGAFVKNKGIDLLLDAIVEISKKNIDNIKFILAGGPLENIKDFIKNNKLENLVEIISPLDYKDLPKVNIRGDIAIDPKTSEVGQASGKILQYMAAGLPVVCFDRKNNHRYLDKAGWYISEMTAKGLVDGILQILQKQGKIKELSKNAQEKAKEFSWSKSAEKIIEIYKKI